MPLSPEAQATRRQGIAATDAAPIMGLSPWESPAEIWLKKKKPELVEEKDSPALYWGSRHEQTIAEEYEKVTCQKLIVSPIVRNKNVPWMMCSPDRLLDGKNKGLECKTASERMAYQWGPAGTDIVPQHYLIQTQHCMMATNFEEWDLAALIGGNDFRIYHLFRDKELMKIMYEQEREFYTRFIKGSETPQFDWGKGVAEYVRRKYPQHTVGKEFSVDDNGDDVIKKAIHDLCVARATGAGVKKVRSTQESLIKAYMGTSEVLEWKEKGIRATWRTAKETSKVDWRAAFERALPHLQMTANEKELLIKECTEEKTGTRRFVFKDSNEENDDE